MLCDALCECKQATATTTILLYSYIINILVVRSGALSVCGRCTTYIISHREKNVYTLIYIIPYKTTINLTHTHIYIYTRDKKIISPPIGELPTLDGGSHSINERTSVIVMVNVRWHQRF